MSRDLHRRCPKCKKLRNYDPPHSGTKRYMWQELDGVRVCMWCIDPVVARRLMIERAASKRTVRKRYAAEAPEREALIRKLQAAGQ